MIFVVEAIGRLACGRFSQRTAPVVASTRIAERAVTLGEPWSGGLGAESSFSGLDAGAGAGRRGEAAAGGAV